MNYIRIPNLPDRAVSSVIMNDPYGICPDGINVIPPKELCSLPAAERFHADMQIVHLGDNIFVCPPQMCKYYRSLLPDSEVIPGEADLKDKYPNNIAYNVCILGNKMICYEEYTDKIILEKASQMGLKILKTHQGYSKCSICVLTQDAIITSDRGIITLAEANGIDALQISAGHILLPGYDYGFIGGCAGKISADTLYFYGDISLHPDFNKINEFANKHNIKLKYSKDYPLTDIGSILPL